MKLIILKVVSGLLLFGLYLFVVEKVQAGWTCTGSGNATSYEYSCPQRFGQCSAWTPYRCELNTRTVRVDCGWVSGRCQRALVISTTSCSVYSCFTTSSACWDSGDAGGTTYTESGCSLVWVPDPTPGPTATPTPTPAPPPSCTVDLLPNTLTVDVGSALTLTASVTIGSGTIDQVNFSSANTSVATVNPASDSTPVYSTQATGVSTGSTTVTSDVVMGGATRCTDTSTINVTPVGPWWQVKDADVTTNGDLTSPIPGSCTLPACNPVFGLRGTGGFPGVPAYGGTTADFLAGTGTGMAAEAPYNWLVNSQYLGKVYDYAYFKRQIPDDVVINEVMPPVTGGTFNSGGTPSHGYVWYHWDGATLGDLTINGSVNLVGSRRVVLMVEGANLYINGLVNFQSPGSGFFMAVVGKDANGLKGNIYVDPSVSHPTQVEIEGVYLAEGVFRTGAASEQLHVRGSVAAYGGFLLERDLGAANANTPAELFEYAPDIIATFPRVFTQRRMRWKEVAP